MESELLNLVITSIKRGNDNQAVANTRAHENDISVLSDTIKEKLTSIFQTTGLRLGRFNIEPRRPNFASTLDEYFNVEDYRFSNFQRFASTLGADLAVELNRGQAQNAKDGFLLTYYYSMTQSDDDTEEEFTDYFLGVIFLHRLDGVDIDPVRLDLEDIEQINLDSLNLGARIDIEQYLNEQSDTALKPIAFKIGRGSAVRVYFQEFVGCSEPSNSKLDSQNLLEAIEMACSRLGYDEDQKRTASEYAENYSLMILNGGQNSMSLEHFAQHVFQEEGEAEQFIAIANESFNLGETVGLDKTEVKKFGTITIRNEAFNIKFSKASLSRNDNSVVWDEGASCLKLYGLSDEDIERLNLNT
ncbi:nucleoid-associated protein [Vibrio harveyi]|uniref:nucleoid-associated protein n=1 Tax=Vibrio harveyi TaxID=669 RepID=UPI001EFDE70B|nr:nucleoid-associated protein [Vibrio harveyi]MCG9611078.1 nucleoid-associated protein [Vibrio harveyi]MCG9668202.1 nucleoid-associated protein [Vibrio harveyi]